MKKINLFFIGAALVAVTACGPSAQEIAEKNRQDSIRMADSISQVEAEKQRVADSIAQVEAAAVAEQARLDSIANAEATKKGGKKK
ncbi:MAG: hypothetical protein A2X11_02505 [Bacteroidetes bacterium GWE2_42_24]|nr:MAG: hypothetical protein A2X11_02505 [Bacteroidetes bacterium GWE2_42_24]OFY32297.1 MAG: hypothetical protein A2X09_11715 [Bacteroidetes bacterium GWF2_43_11]PKP23598.1 MAG: hypothetical protein CVU06_07465 [Bacteroidetes bacterium HGW-Bacteroidetes-22]